MAVGRERFYFPPPSTSTDYDSIVDKTTAIAEQIATADETQALRENVEQLEIKQEDLNNRQDLLSPLEDFGSCFANGQGNLINTGVVPFNQQVGPMTGCHLENNQIVLDDFGLWTLQARLSFSYTVVPGQGGIAWEIRTVSPSGGIFDRQYDVVDHMGSTTRPIDTSVVVPTAGYRVEVRITSLAPVRATIGGKENNRFTVHHISRSTTFQT
ncbi:hypothetical protein L5I01_17565 [Gordonia sp. HY442]|uniref:hypothetical protein n=1 Tax=Gordonia zhenghanii TaxID=2911516 RepID=UPI001F1AA868|nr:hypothetical protein [Gordonia zhenghanii]MCF8605165.1 hypothetical protein [Gordonia zhenghanii]